MKRIETLKTGNILIEGVTAYYPFLDAPDTSPYGRDKYALTFFVPKDSEALKSLDKHLKVLVKKASVKIKDAKNYPLRDGDKMYTLSVERTDNDFDLTDEEKEKKKAAVEHYKGNVRIKTISSAKPKIVDRSKKEITDTSSIGFTGALLNVVVFPYVYKKPNEGITLILKAVQVVEEGGGSFGDSGESAFTAYTDTEKKDGFETVNPDPDDEDLPF